MIDGAGAAFSARPSLRTRLVITSTIACLAAFMLAGGILYLSIRDSLYRQFDDALTARATALSALLEQEGSSVRLQADPSVTSAYAAGQHRYYFEIIDAGGATLLKSPSLGGAHLVRPPSGEESRYDTVLPDGKGGRVVSLPFLARPDEERPPPAGQPAIAATVLVASDIKHVDDSLFRFAKQLIFVCGGATAMAAVTLSLLISRQMRPVHDLAEQIARVGRADLSERLDAGPAPAELLPVVTRLNEMLERLGEAFEREKGFTADVAHELRTPISALETALEVSGSRLREPEAYRQTVSKCLRTVRDMHALVDRLLTLARADARQLTVHPQRVELRPFMEEIWDTVAEQAARRGVGVKWDVAPGSAIVTDPEILRQVVQNALDNAATYAGVNTLVAVTARAESRGGMRVDFVNPAPGMTTEQVTRVFDRFWRADGARQAGHVGLGLPLCQKLMQALGGKASAAIDPAGCFRLSLAFSGEVFRGIGRTC